MSGAVTLLPCRCFAGRAFQAHPDCAEHGEAPTPAEELTPIGVQLVIPGCERREPDDGPRQGSLW